MNGARFDHCSIASLKINQVPPFFPLVAALLRMVVGAFAKALWNVIAPIRKSTLWNVIASRNRGSVSPGLWRRPGRMFQSARAR